MHLTKNQDYHQQSAKKKLQNKKEVRVELLETAGNAHSSISLLGLPRQKLWGSLSHPPGHYKASTFSPPDRKSETP